MKKKQRVYTIPVFWDSWGTHKVKATSLQEAIKKSDDMGLPEKMEYIDGSYEYDMQGIEIYNKKILSKDDKKFLEGRELDDGTTIVEFD